MDKVVFVEHLRQAAELLKPFTVESSPGDKHWDGTAYVAREGSQFDAGALAWWSTLTAIAEMIDAQDAPITDKQKAYLDNLLFGGMGSLNDLSIPSQSVGKVAEKVNAELDRQRRALFKSFHG